jgi:hypothetical protein
VNNADQLNMKFALFRNGKELFQRGPESHWWLTGFKWGVFTPSTSDLTMHLEIVFPNTAMRDAFRNAALQKRYLTREKDPFSIAFSFHKPRTTQPDSRARLEGQMQQGNERLVAGYLMLKQALKISNNDPNSFAALDVPAHKAAKVISGVAKKVRHDASGAAKRLTAASPVAKKLQSKAGAAAQELLHTEVSDEVRAAYTEITSFFDTKVWCFRRQPGSTA